MGRLNRHFRFFSKPGWIHTQTLSQPSRNVTEFNINHNPSEESINALVQSFVIYNGEKVYGIELIPEDSSNEA